MSELLNYAQQTFLDPDVADPEDLAYFGSTCFGVCMQHLAARAAHLPKESCSTTVLWQEGGLAVFAQCAGTLCLLQLCCQSCQRHCPALHMYSMTCPEQRCACSVGLSMLLSKLLRHVLAVLRGACPLRPMERQQQPCSCGIESAALVVVQLISLAKIQTHECMPLYSKWFQAHTV